MPRLRLSHISLALQDMASASDEADLLLRQAAAVDGTERVRTVPVLHL